MKKFNKVMMTIGPYAGWFVFVAYLSIILSSEKPINVWFTVTTVCWGISAACSTVADILRRRKVEAPRAQRYLSSGSLFAILATSIALCLEIWTAPNYGNISIIGKIFFGALCALLVGCFIFMIISVNRRKSQASSKSNDDGDTQ